MSSRQRPAGGRPETASTERDDVSVAARAPMPLVLIADDDPQTRRYLRATLAEQRLRVVEAESGSEALVQASAHNPDLVLLDFKLPDLDGLQVTARLRKWMTAPILVVSVHDEELDKVAALDAGADDYVIKPFSTGELLARIRVWLRHSQRADVDPMNPVLQVGDLRIDLAKRLAFVGDRELLLTPMQYKLFALLMRNAGKLLTHEEIISAVWGPAYARETQYVRVYVGKLRQKLELDAGRPRYLVTEPGLGYRLRGG